MFFLVATMTRDDYPLVVVSMLTLLCGTDTFHAKFQPSWIELALAGTSLLGLSLAKPFPYEIICLLQGFY